MKVKETNMDNLVTLSAKIIKVVEEDKHPNSITKKAIVDARSRKTSKIDDLNLFLKNI